MLVINQQVLSDGSHKCDPLVIYTHWCYYAPDASPNSSFGATRDLSTNNEAGVFVTLSPVEFCSSPFEDPLGRESCNMQQVWKGTIRNRAGITTPFKRLSVSSMNQISMPNVTSMLDVG